MEIDQVESMKQLHVTSSDKIELNTSSGLDNSSLEGDLDAMPVTPPNQRRPMPASPMIMSALPMRHITMIPPSSPMRLAKSKMRKHSIKLSNVPGTPKSLLVELASSETSSVQSSDEDSPPTTPQRTQAPTPLKLSPVKRKIPDSFSDRPRLRRRPSVFNDREFKGKHNVSRFKQEFVELGVLGMGSFGTVYKCKNNLDEKIYAIKRSNRCIAGMADESQLIREVQAHANIKNQEHIVRYFSAWEEDDHMLIQNEYCDGGNLVDLIAQRRARGTPFTEEELHDMMKQLAEGLRCMHSDNIVHLDIKPENIFLCHSKVTSSDTPIRSSVMQLSLMSTKRPTQQDDSGLTAEVSFINRSQMHDVSSEDDDDVFYSTPSVRANTSIMPSMDQDEPAALESGVVYKIGDLGHATSTLNPSVEDGDSRYLPKEILDGNFAELTKADIFSLGVTLYEAATLKMPAPNGPEWHLLRDDHPPQLLKYSHAFNEIVLSMLRRDPHLRPSSKEVLNQPLFVRKEGPAEEKSKQQLAAELHAEKERNFMLSQQLNAGAPAEPAPQPTRHRLRRMNTIS